MIFFEFINIKSFSEAYCESEGSMMNILVDKGRNLTPSNFSRELILSFNSPPLHILAKTIIPELVKQLLKDKRMEFFRTSELSNLRRLKFETLSAPIGNYCKTGIFRKRVFFGIFGIFQKNPKITLFRNFSEKLSRNNSGRNN